MLIGLTPDLAIAAGVVVALLLEALAPRAWRRPAIVIAGISACTVAGGALLVVGDSVDAIAGYTLRPWATPLRLAAVISTAVAFTMLPSQIDRGNRRQRRIPTPGVAAVLLLAALLGTMTLAAAGDLVAFLVSLELATIPLLVLVALFQDARGSEAALKFLIQSSLATGLMLMGMSYAYGAAGAVDFAGLAAGLDCPLGATAAVLLVLAVLFKLGAVPMHAWAPDAYAGAPNPVAMQLASGSKVTGLIALLMLWDGPLHAYQDLLRPLLVAAALGSLLIGNLGALRQDDLRRFLGWSSIAQVGFFLIAVGSGVDAVIAIGFYAVIYTLSNGVVFLVLDALCEARAPRIASLHGLARQAPGLALALTLALFSLAGIPPLAGFLGKFGLLLAPAHRGAYALVLLGALAGVVSLYYYLRVVRACYLVSPATTPPSLRLDGSQRLGVTLCTLGIVVLGLWSGAHDWVAALVR